MLAESVIFHIVTKLPTVPEELEACGKIVEALEGQYTLMKLKGFLNEGEFCSRPIF